MPLLFPCIRHNPYTQCSCVSLRAWKRQGIDIDCSPAHQTFWESFWKVWANSALQWEILWPQDWPCIRLSVSNTGRLGMRVKSTNGLLCLTKLNRHCRIGIVKQPSVFSCRWLVVECELEGSSGHWRILVLQTSTPTDIYNLTGLTFLLALTFILQTYSGKWLAVVVEGRGKRFYFALRAGAAHFSDGVVWLSNYFFL